MAILTSIQSHTIANGNFAEACVFYKEFLKTAGWIVVGSAQSTSDVSGGMHYDGGATDRIGSDYNNMQPTGWFVLESPHTAQADRIQLLFYNDPVTTYYGQFRWTPTAADGDRYESPDEAVPTSTYENIGITSSLFSSNKAYRFHMVAEDIAPYSVAILSTEQRNAEGSGFCFSVLSMNLDYDDVNGGKPIAVISNVNNILNYRLENIDNISTSASTSKIEAEPYSPPQIPISSPGATLRVQGSTLVVPNGISQDPDSKSLSLPVTLCSTTQYFGISDFMQWNGTKRFRLETFNDGTGPMTRISFGDVSFPWDGSTVPII